MKTSIKKLLFFAGLVVTGQALAGHETGNGGAGFVCPANHDSGAVQSVELLDFWEGEALRGLAIRRNKNSLEEQLDEALGTLCLASDCGLSRATGDYLLRIGHQIATDPDVFLPPGVGIAAPEDARNEYVKKGCVLQGIALYNDRYDTLELDRELYEKLSLTDTAGLRYHEAVYKVLREWFGVKDSKVARAITACSFAKKPCPELDPRDGIVKAGGYTCTVSQWTAGEQGPSRVEIFPGGSCPAHLSGESWRIQVTSLTLKPSPTKSYIDICPSIDIRPFLTGTLPPQTVYGHQERHLARASENRLKDIAIPMIIHASFDHGAFHINQRRMHCTAH